MKSIEAVYPEWKILAWRMLRGAVASAIAQTIVDVCPLLAEGNVVACWQGIIAKWGNWRMAVVMIGISLGTGFIIALGKAIRDEFAKDGTSILKKIVI